MAKNLLEMLAEVASQAQFNNNDLEDMTVLRTVLTSLSTFIAETGTDTGNASTINAANGKVTSDALTTAAGATQDIVITNDRIAATSVAVAVVNGYAGAGTPVILKVTCATDTLTITIMNIHASAALDAAVVVDFITRG